MIVNLYVRNVWAVRTQWSKERASLVDLETKMVVTFNRAKMSARLLTVKKSAVLLTLMGLPGYELF